MNNNKKGSWVRDRERWETWGIQIRCCAAPCSAARSPFDHFEIRANLNLKVLTRNSMWSNGLRAALQDAAQQRITGAHLNQTKWLVFIARFLFAEPQHVPSSQLGTTVDLHLIIINPVNQFRSSGPEQVLNPTVLRAWGLETTTMDISSFQRLEPANLQNHHLITALHFIWDPEEYQYLRTFVGDSLHIIILA
jgi:hypothetical protein